MSDDEDHRGTEGDRVDSSSSAPPPPVGPTPPGPVSYPPGYGPQVYPVGAVDAGPQAYPGTAPGYGPQPFPGGYQPYGPTGHGRPVSTNGRATTSMVLGIFGLVSMLFCYGLLSIVLGPIAFFMGRSAQKEIERSPHSWSNAGMARAGWIMGLIQTILSVVVIVVVVVFFSYLFRIGALDGPDR